MSEASDFNRAAMSDGDLRWEHVSELVRQFQRANGLPVDGKAGPSTRAQITLLSGRLPGDAPRPTPTIPIAQRDTIADLNISDGWLTGPGVVVMPMHASWYYRALATGTPKAIVAHYTSTEPGTAVAMAKHRAAPFQQGNDRAASWHLSIEADGSIVQMAPLTAGTWHAGGPSAKPISGLGPANRTALGIELVGLGHVFPEAQVLGACRVWRAVVRAYGVERARAMVTHQELDPTRKTDPGPVWMGEHAPRVLEYAFT